jgi:hypothetical protein
MTSRWRQPYRSEADETARQVIGVGLALAGLFPVCGTAVTTARPGPTLAALAFVAVWETMLWRAFPVGLYVSESGVKVRTVWRSRVLPWSAVTRVRAGPATGSAASAVWISTTTGPDVETPIWRRGPRVWRRNRVWLDPDAFAQLIADLNIRVRLD